jgi:hypothetical protein
MTRLSRSSASTPSAPHLEGGGSVNSACVMEVGGRSILAARKGPIWLAVAATVPFSRLSLRLRLRTRLRTRQSANCCFCILNEVFSSVWHHRAGIRPRAFIPGLFNLCSYRFGRWRYTVKNFVAFLVR